MASADFIFDGETHYQNPRGRGMLAYPEPEIIHLGVRNFTTGRIGGCDADTRDIQTICSVKWVHPNRPKRTLRRDKVTCEECKTRQVLIPSIFDKEGVYYG